MKKSDEGWWFLCFVWLLFFIVIGFFVFLVR